MDRIIIMDTIIIFDAIIIMASRHNRSHIKTIYWLHQYHHCPPTSHWNDDKSYRIPPFLGHPKGPKTTESSGANPSS